MVVFLVHFCNNCYHQIEMISFIKLFSCHSVFPAAAHAVEVIVLVVDLNSDEFFNVFERFCVDMWWGVFLGRRRVVYPFPALFFFVTALNIIC